MTWLPFAITAYLVWAFSNLLSKVLISSYISNVIVYTVVIGASNVVPTFLIPFKGLIIPSFSLLFIAFLAGSLYVAVLVLYFKALSLEEPSRVIPLWRFTPIFTLLFSGNLIDENLNGYQAIAFILLVVGGFGVSIKRIEDTFKLSSAFYLMFLSSLIAGIYNVLIKFVYLHLSYYDGFTLVRFGAALTAFSALLIPKNRLELISALASVSKRIKSLILLNGLLDLIGLAFLNYAIKLKSVSLVTASAGIQAVFVLLFSALLSLKFPNLFKEDLSRASLLQKGGAIALIVVGTLLLSLG
ncbi:MAG: EamA family transporter [Trichocoleus desertorum ATA4-8-CV12]|nr:EamA family transporter [Trichocoleus desertorum ATA4-8-CV12]